MSVFSKIRQSLGTRSLLKKQKKLHRNRVVHNFHTARTTFIIFDSTDPEIFRQIRDFSKYLENLKIKTGLLGYVQLDEIPSDLVLWENCQIFGRKDLDFLFRPKDLNVLNFIEQEYDILFDLSLKDYFPLTFITSLSRAKFKVGRYRETLNDCDFMINISGEPTVDFLIAQIKNYVSILNNQEKAGKIPIE